MWWHQYLAEAENERKARREWVNELCWKWRLMRNMDSLTPEECQRQFMLIRHFVPDLMACHND